MRARLVPSGISIRANTHSSRMVGHSEAMAVRLVDTSLLRAIRSFEQPLGPSLVLGDGAAIQ